MRGRPNSRETPDERHRDADRPDGRAAHRLVRNRTPAAALPGRPGNASTIFRWITAGVLTPDGRVRLEAVRLGGRWLTSAAALQRFVLAQTPAPARETVPPRPPAARQRASEGAADELRRLGVGGDRTPDD